MLFLLWRDFDWRLVNFILNFSEFSSLNSLALLVVAHNVYKYERTNSAFSPVHEKTFIRCLPFSMSQWHYGSYRTLIILYGLRTLKWHYNNKCVLVVGLIYLFHKFWFWFETWELFTKSYKNIIEHLKTCSFHRRT